MEDVCERENLKEALRQVKANKGGAGIDRMTERSTDETNLAHSGGIFSTSGPGPDG
jgi:hypothetical protein